MFLNPQPAGNVTFASYATETANGQAERHWEKSTTEFKLGVTVVPVGSTAMVYVPSNDAKNITESGKPIQAGVSVHFLRVEDGYAVYAVSWGNYSFLDRNRG